MREGDRQAGRRDLEIEGEDRVGEVEAVFHEHRRAAGGGGRTGAGDARELHLFEGDAGGAAIAVGDRVDVAIEHVIELQRAGGGRGAGVADDQMVELQRIVRVGKIGLADDHRVGRSVRVNEQRPLLAEIETIGRAAGRAAGAFDLQHRAGGDCAAVNGRPLRDQPEAARRLARVVDRQRPRHLVGASRDMHRPVVGDRGGDRGLDRAGVVVAVVAERAATAHVDPRPAGADQHVAAEGRGAGGRKRREITRRLRRCGRHIKGDRDQECCEGKRCYELHVDHVSSVPDPCFANAGFVAMRPSRLRFAPHLRMRTVRGCHLLTFLILRSGPPDRSSKDASGLCSLVVDRSSPPSGALAGVSGAAIPRNDRTRVG